MRNITKTIILIFLFLSCKSTDKNNEKKVIQSNSATVEITNGDSLIIGIWWDDNKNAFHASLVFQNTKICYLLTDSNAIECKYKIKKDSLIVYEKNGKKSISKIQKLTNDTLKLITTGKKQIFTKNKTANCE